MNNTIEIIETNNNTGTSIELSERMSAYQAVAGNPFLRNVMGKSNSTITRHLQELDYFGQYLADPEKLPSKKNAVPHLSMQQPSHWKDVTADSIEGYKVYLTYVRGLRTTTISQIIYIIRSYARVAYDAGTLSIEELTRIEHIKGISGSEAVHIDEHREKTSDRDRHNVGGNVTTLTKKQVTMLKFGHPDSLDGKRDALLFCILLDHGLRISDAIALKRSDIDMEDKMIRFTTKKTGVSLNLRMTEDVYNAFCEYFEMFQPATDESSIWTGVNKHGKAQGSWGKHSAQMEITIIAKSMGIRNLSAHDLRHCWTDRAIEGGSDLVAIQQAGGWKSLQMVGRYATKKAVSNSGVKLS